MTTEIPREEQENVRENEILARLKKIAKDGNYANPRFRVSPGSAKGQNFLGDIFRTTIEGERDGKVERICSIIKCVPEFQFMRNVFQASTMFEREIMFYREIVPIFQKLLHEHGLELEDIPKFYGADDTPNKEIVVLEDLREKGYEPRDRLKLLDYPHATLAVRSLGRFHAYSFALRDKHPDTFKKLQSIQHTMQDAMDNPNEAMQTLQNGLVSLALKSIKDEDTYYVKRVTKFLENLHSKIMESNDGSFAEPYAVLCHGDAWTNNLLFKYDDEAKTKPTSMYLLDFQVCRYASPVTDILYTLFCCCSQETRREHYKQLLLDYHESLSNCLRQLGCDPEILFSYKVFEQQLKKFGYYGAAMAICILHVFTDVNADLKELAGKSSIIDGVEERLTTDKFFKSMMSGVLIDSVDMNYI